MVCRTGLHTTMGRMVRQLVAPSQAAKEKDPFIPVCCKLPSCAPDLCFALGLLTLQTAQHNIAALPCVVLLEQQGYCMQDLVRLYTFAAVLHLLLLLCYLSIPLVHRFFSGADCSLACKMS